MSAGRNKYGNTNYFALFDGALRYNPLAMYKRVTNGIFYFAFAFHLCHYFVFKGKLYQGRNIMDLGLFHHLLPYIFNRTGA